MAWELNPPAAGLPPAAELPPLFAALLGGDSDRATEQLEAGCDPCHTLTSGLTALHAAALGGAAGAVPALVAAGVPINAQLLEPLQLPKDDGDGLSFDKVPPGSTALALACARSTTAAVQALLAAGATYKLPTLSSSAYQDIVAEGAGSPWHWAAERSMSSRYHGSEEAVAAAMAVRAGLLENALQCAAAELEPQSEQLVALLVIASLAPSCTGQLSALAALPGAADALNAGQRRRLAGWIVKKGDVAAVDALQAGPLRQQPLDPNGKLLQSIAGDRGEKALPMARALLQVRGTQRAQGLHSLCCAQLLALLLPHC